MLNTHFGQLPHVKMDILLKIIIMFYNKLLVYKNKSENNCLKAISINKNFIF